MCAITSPERRLHLLSYPGRDGLLSKKYFKNALSRVFFLACLLTIFLVEFELFTGKTVSKFEVQSLSENF